MNILVNNTLTKSRNPSEFEFNITGQTGTVVSQIKYEDCYLVEFPQMEVKTKFKIWATKKNGWTMKPLKWYVYKEDFKII